MKDLIYCGKLVLLKRLLSVLLLLLFSVPSFAVEFVVDGIEYNTTSSTTVEVTSNFYSGVIDIPSSVEYNAMSYDVTSIGEFAFEGCTSLTSITIPNSVTSIAYQAFYGCTSLTSITIPNSVTSIDCGAFMDCAGLTSISVEQGNTHYDSRDGCNAIIESETNSLISGCKNTVIPNSVTSIGKYAFYGCTSLTSITIPNSVTSIGKSAFYNCTSLTSMTIPNSVTCISIFAFQYCTSLTSITIPNSVTSIEAYAFYGCTSLTSMTIPNSVTSIGTSIFYSCPSLASISVEQGNTHYDSRDGCNAIIESETNTLISGCKNTVIPNSVTSIAYQAFDGCTGLTSITIPNSVTSIGIIGAFGGDTMAFSSCPGLTSISVEQGNTHYDSRDGCNAIIESKTNTLICGCKNTVIPNSVTTIGNRAFCGSSLTSITIPNSVTSIENYAFRKCTELSSITIPNSVTSIGEFAFSGCGNLENFYCYAEAVPTTNDLALDFALYNATLYVPAASVALYEAAEPWSEFVNIVGISADKVITTNQVGEDYWATFFSSVSNYQADANTTVYAATKDGSTLNLIEVADRIIKAGEGVILKSTSSTLTLTLTSTAAIDSYYADNVLEGVDEAKAQANGKTYYVLSDENSKLGFYKYTGTLGANKAFISVTNANAPLYFDFAEWSTGVNTAEKNNSVVSHDDKVYNLNGQRVEKSTKGMYIVNGRKVIK